MKIDISFHPQISKDSVNIYVQKLYNKNENSMVISQLSIVKKKAGNQNRNLHFLVSTFHVGPVYSFILLSFFLFIFNMKSSDSSFVAKAVNSCRNIGQDVSSELPRLVFELWVPC